MTIKNIPVGYKDSPLGIIPQEWEVKKLGDLCNSINSGGSKQRNDNGKYPIYGSTGLIGYSNVCIYDIPQILVARVGAHAGYVYCVDGNYDVSDNTLILNLKSTYHFDFAYNQLLHCNLNKYVFGSGQPLVTAGQLKLLKLPLPPLAEQEKIAEILSTWDKAIDKQTQLIEKLELRKKGLMQQLLTGKKRLPGFTGEWKKVKINQCFFLISETNDGGSYLPMTISAKSGFVSQKKKFDRVIAGNSIDKYILLRKGDFAYNKGNSNLYEMGCIYQLKEESALVPFVYICFRAKEFVCGDFYQQYFLNHGLDRQLKRIITSGARGDGLLNVDKTDFFNLEIIYPTLQEQIAIANILSSCDKEIRLEQNKLVSMKEQKKGLMQVLLTGKRRVKL